jgi:pantoate--beta-alanine ligase
LSNRGKPDDSPYLDEPMIVFKYSKYLRKYLENIKREGLSTGFVPTMGALHAGHLSLISQSMKNTDVTICSIFVNPVQFNNKDDFQKYPSSIENDILLLEESGCDILFMPDEQEIYPDEESKIKHFAIGPIENILEGKFRPGHFQGVCNVVEKLLKIIEPSHLFLGQKDYQQCLIIRKLIRLLHLNIKVIICPIIREPGGLAMSSRNRRLNENERKTAAKLHESLNNVKTRLPQENFLTLKQLAISDLGKEGFRIDYLEMANAGDLELIENSNGNYNTILLIAAFLNDVRLIDNLMVKD